MQPVALENTKILTDYAQKSPRTGALISCLRRSELIMNNWINLPEFVVEDTPLRKTKPANTWRRLLRRYLQVPSLGEDYHKHHLICVHTQSTFHFSISHASKCCGDYPAWRPPSILRHLNCCRCLTYFGVIFFFLVAMHISVEVRVQLTLSSCGSHVSLNRWTDDQ